MQKVSNFDRPGDFHPAQLVAEAAILGGVGRQFVQCHAERLGGSGGHCNGRPRQRDAAASLAEVLKLAADEFGQIEALPLAFHQKVLVRSERPHPSGRKC